jgi:hypothetical protein
VLVLEGLALPHACHSGDIALAGSRRLRSMLAAAPILLVHAAVTVATYQVVWHSLVLKMLTTLMCVYVCMYQQFCMRACTAQRSFVRSRMQADCSR